MPPAAYPTELDSVVYTFEPSCKGAYADYNHGKLPWTLREAFCGTQIFGMTGSGKTSGSGCHLALAFLRQQFGGLVLCHKIEEVQYWKQLAAATDRLQDLIIFSGKNGSRFNFLDYESKFTGGNTENLYRLFAVLAEVGERSLGGSPPDPFWKNALKELVINAIELLKLAKKPVTLPNIERIITSSPSQTAQLDSDDWKESSFCFQALCDAFEQPKSPGQQIDFNQTTTYWLKALPALAPQTRSCVFAMFTGTAVALMRGPSREIFCNGSTNVFPESTLDGKIIVLALPVKEFFESGRYAQILFKYMWQRVIERRTLLPGYENNVRPQFIWADEAHNFFVSHDMEFQTTARSSRVATVYLTQNMENYRTVIPEANREAIVSSFLGNMQTKIFHANQDQATNLYASEQIGKRHFLEIAESKQWNRDEWTFRWFAKVMFGKGKPSNESETTNTRYDNQVLPIEFSILRRGGKEDAQIVEAFVAGKILRSNSGFNDILKDWIGRANDDVGFIRAQFKQIDLPDPKPEEIVKKLQESIYERYAEQISRSDSNHLEELKARMLDEYEQQIAHLQL